jgi:hypothetical protein
MSPMVNLSLAAGSFLLLALGLLVRHYTFRASYKNLALRRRLQLFSDPPSDFGVVAEPQRAWAVIMDSGYPTGSASLIALSNGDASLTYDRGGDTLAEGEPGVASAVRRFVEQATADLSRFSPTQARDLPLNGRTRFYIRTLEGMIFAEAPSKKLAHRWHPLSELFYAGQEVSRQLRLLPDETDKE